LHSGGRVDVPGRVGVGHHADRHLCAPWS
jgi:hypothetical protein